jgi:hypothetical protein
MEYKKLIFKIDDGSKSYRKWKDNKIHARKDLKEVEIEHIEKNQEQIKLLNSIFEPYLKEILAQFPQKK